MFFVFGVNTKNQRGLVAVPVTEGVEALVHEVKQRPRLWHERFAKLPVYN